MTKLNHGPITLVVHAFEQKVTPIPRRAKYQGHDFAKPKDIIIIDKVGQIIRYRV